MKQILASALVAAVLGTPAAMGQAEPIAVIAKRVTEEANALKREADEWLARCRPPVTQQCAADAKLIETKATALEARTRLVMELLAVELLKGKK